jgi:hypothetical protein
MRLAAQVAGRAAVIKLLIAPIVEPLATGSSLDLLERPR